MEAMRQFRQRHAALSVAALPMLLAAVLAMTSAAAAAVLDRQLPAIDKAAPLRTIHGVLPARPAAGNSRMQHTVASSTGRRLIAAGSQLPQHPRKLPKACGGKCAKPHKIPSPSCEEARPPSLRRPVPPVRRLPPPVTKRPPPPAAKRPPPPPQNRPPPLAAAQKPPPPPPAARRPPPAHHQPPPSTKLLPTMPPVRKQPPPAKMPPLSVQAVPDPTAQRVLGDWVGGIATYYGGQYQFVEGSCGLGVLDKAQYPNWNVVALSPLNRLRSAGPQQACGTCFQVQCVDGPGTGYEGRCGSIPTNTTETVMVNDTCPECEANHLDLQAGVFGRLAPAESGIIAVRYRQVACQPTGGIRVVVTHYNGPGLYLRVTFQNVAGTAMVHTVRFRGAGEGRGARSLIPAEPRTPPNGPNEFSRAANRVEGVAAASGQPVAPSHRMVNQTAALHTAPTAAGALRLPNRHIGRGLKAAPEASRDGIGSGSSMQAGSSGVRAAAMGGDGGRALQQAAGSSWQAEAAAFGGQPAVNQYGAAWAVDSAPPFPIDLFIATDQGTITFPAVIPSLPEGDPEQDMSFQTQQQFAY